MLTNVNVFGDMVVRLPILNATINSTQKDQSMVIVAPIQPAIIRNAKLSKKLTESMMFRMSCYFILNLNLQECDMRIITM